MSDKLILALDLASQTGWALGRVYDRIPQSGSIRFAPKGASLGMVFSECRKWLKNFLIYNPGIEVIVFEAPMVPSHMIGNTNANTIRMLIGLTAVIEEATYQMGYDVREARVSDVRYHFLLKVRVKRAAAKVMTIAACRRLGWNPCDDNAADALALWHYQASVFEPKLAVQTSPLFHRGMS